MTDLQALRQTWKHHYPLVLLFLWMLFSLLYSQNLEMGLDKIQRAVILPVSILIYSGLRLSKKGTLSLLVLFAFLVILACLYSHTLTINQFLLNQETEFRSLFNLNYSYLALGKTLDIHPTYYAFFIVSAIIILLDQLGRLHANWTKFLFGIGIAYLSFFIIHLSSRVGIVILYAIILHQIFRVLIKKKAIVQGLILLVGFHLFLFLLISQIGITKYRFQHIFGFKYYTGYEVNDGNHKLALWSEAVSSNEQFLFGNGIGDIGDSLKEQFANAGLKKPAERGYNSHNQYIEYYVGIGFIGMILFLNVLFYYFRNFFRSSNHIGIYFIFALSIFCITECIWNRHHGIVFSVIMLGVLHFLNSGSPGSITTPNEQDRDDSPDSGNIS